MSEATAAPCPRRYGRWHFTARGLAVLAASAALGVFFGICERGWNAGAMAALSLWIVLGLAAQVHDLWTTGEPSGALTAEERWGWRFAVTWRLVIAGVIAGYFVVRCFATWLALDLERGLDSWWASPRLMGDAILLTAVIVAIASSPRFVRKPRGRVWMWGVEPLSYIAVGIIWAFALRDRVLVAALVHITIAGIGSAQCPELSQGFASYSMAQLVWFAHMTTAGVISILASCAMLRLLCFCWRRGMLARAVLGVLLASSLAVTVALAVRIALVEIPTVSPLLAAHIFLPAHRLALAAVLVLLLITPLARRWSEPLPALSATASGTWRRDEGRYYHERRWLILLLAVVVAVPLLPLMLDFWAPWGWGCSLWYLVIMPEGALPLALVCLAVESEISARRKPSPAAAMDRARMAPGLFVLIWAVLLVIVLAAAPILGAWGFAHCLIVT